MPRDYRGTVVDGTADGQLLTADGTIARPLSIRYFFTTPRVHYTRSAAAAAPCSLIAIRALLIPHMGSLAWRPGYSIPKLPGRCCHVCADSKRLEWLPVSLAYVHTVGATGLGGSGLGWSGLAFSWPLIPLSYMAYLDLT